MIKADTAIQCGSGCRWYSGDAKDGACAIRDGYVNYTSGCDRYEKPPTGETVVQTDDKKQDATKQDDVLKHMGKNGKAVMDAIIKKQNEQGAGDDAVQVDANDEKRSDFKKAIGKTNANQELDEQIKKAREALHIADEEAMADTSAKAQTKLDEAKTELERLTTLKKNSTSQ